MFGNRRRGYATHRGCAVSIIAGAILMFSSCSFGHEVPSELTVDAFLKPEHQILKLLIRVPLSGLMGIDMPKEGIGYLALDRIEPTLQKAALLLANGLDIYEDGARLNSPRVVSTQVSLPFDTSFASYSAALAHLSGPRLPIDMQVYWLQGSVDALIEYPIRSDSSSFSLRTRLNTLAPQVTTALRFLPPDGSVRPFTFLGDPGAIWLDPRWYQAGVVFFKQGFRHILGIRDQWIFALCMLMAFNRLQSLPTILASFGLGQFLTSVVMAYGPDATGPWLAPLVATAVAGFLLCLAIENIAARHLDRRWTTMWFGLVSGIGFSIAMRALTQFAGNHRLTSILSFDLGVQFGQLLLFAVVGLPLLLLSRIMVNQRLRTIIVSALVANVAWNALTTRAEELGNASWPLLTPEVVVTGTSWLIVIVVGAGIVWFILGLQKSPAPRTAASFRKVEGH
jgi:hypothetical protein